MNDDANPSQVTSGAMTGERYARNIVYVRWTPGDQYRPLESFDELADAIRRSDELAAGAGPTDVKVVDLENLDLGDMRDHVSRERAMNVICPRCKARPGEPCLGSRVPPQPRKAVHRQRLDVVRRP